MRPTTLILVLCALYVCLGSYTKIQFLKTDYKVTGINTCKSASNAVYTTSDGYLNFWVGYKTVTSYSVSPSDWHYLECSRYGQGLGNVYIAVLGSDGLVTVWEQVEKVFSVYLDQKEFDNGYRKARATTVSVGGRLLAVGYADLQIIDVYWAENSSLYTSITTYGNFTEIKLDIDENLLVLTLT